MNADATKLIRKFYAEAYYLRLNLVTSKRLFLNTVLCFTLKNCSETLILSSLQYCRIMVINENKGNAFCHA